VKLLCFLLIMAMAAMASKPPILTTLYNFSNDDGEAYAPYGGLVRAHNGVLYGTTSAGGAFGNGVVYSLTPPGSGGRSWLYQVLYSFRGASQGDGSNPAGTLVLASQGSLLGTTQGGGANNAGTVYKLSPSQGGIGPWSEAILYSFSAFDVNLPSSGLTVDSVGNLYGSTVRYNVYAPGGVFRLSPPSTPGGTWTETTLFEFQGGAAGSTPGDAVPLVDATGNLYGTTLYGGVNSGAPYGQLGTVYELSPSQSPGAPWNEEVIFSFPNPSAGAQPAAGLIMDSSGCLYGTTSRNVYSVTHGSVFKLTPPTVPGLPWTEQVLWNFLGPADGSAQSPLVFDAQGNLYGTTIDYGDLSACTMGCGTVFKLLAPANNPTGAWAAGWNFEFTGINGSIPFGNLVLENGSIYGVTYTGGQYGYGTVFQLQQ